MNDDYRLFDTASGNAVVAALDHGIGMGAVDGFEDPLAVTESVLDAEPDGVLVGPHFARRYADAFASSPTDVLVTADFVTFSTHPGEDVGRGVQTQPFDVDLLCDIDPAGVKAVLAFGREDRATFRRNVEYIGRLERELRGAKIPLIVETVMWGEGVPSRFETEAEYVADATRIGWELGADVLKVPYTGSVESFEPIASNAPVPTMILGGAASGSTRALLGDVAGAIEAGARGLIVGRSIWQTEDPAAVVEAMNGIVHHGEGVSDVWG